jgi:hypothetical protein
VRDEDFLHISAPADGDALEPLARRLRESEAERVS